MVKFIVKDDKMYFGERELPPLPHKKKVLSPTIIGDEIFVNGYELFGDKWKRTFKAWLCNHIGWWI